MYTVYFVHDYMLGISPKDAMPMMICKVVDGVQEIYFLGSVENFMEVATPLIGDFKVSVMIARPPHTIKVFGLYWDLEKYSAQQLIKEFSEGGVIIQRDENKIFTINEEGVETILSRK